MLNQILAIALAVVMSVVPMKKQNDYATFIRWTGCKAEIVLTDEGPAIKSFFRGTPEKTWVVVGLEPSEFDTDEELYVVAHETSHCLQWQSDPDRLIAAHVAARWFGDPTMLAEIELEADRNAADLLCLYHKDGAQAGNSFFDKAHELYGYNGDPFHGTLEERKSAASTAIHCQPAAHRQES